MSKDWSGNQQSMFSMLGARNYAQGDRETNDYYATPPKALELLLELEDFSPNVWECACGEGHLSEVLKKRGFNVRSSDLIDRGYGEGGVDFLKISEKYDGDIITNPPYKFAQEFVEKALEIITDGHKIAMFLRIQFLEGKSRRRLFDSTPPTWSMFQPGVSFVRRTEIFVRQRETPYPTHGLFGKKDTREIPL